MTTSVLQASLEDDDHASTHGQCILELTRTPTSSDCVFQELSRTTMTTSPHCPALSPVPWLVPLPCAPFPPMPPASRASPPMTAATSSWMPAPRLSFCSPSLPARCCRSRRFNPYNRARTGAACIPLCCPAFPVGRPLRDL
ncbi:hypothetical protein MSAN_01301400 [Mycena sanguinolenta]|uniref:Uncharacterized protein n=1 Tax=Mycena sanguinolenta TaxID=230812 RepID=A0A8H7D366_9AGAR|nr:hypothetical protein MSAN_01301400 [Mycena sanguinolenta]